MRSTALKEHAWPNARNAACGLEPLTGSKFAAEKQKGFVCEFCDLDRAPAAQPVLIRNHRDAAHWIEQPNPKTVVIHRHESEVHIAELKTARHRDPSFLDQLNFDARVPAPITTEEIRKGIFNDLRRSRDADNARFTLFDRARLLVEGLDFCQQAAAKPKQGFALRGEF
ncbi:MAG TPA: hypothetical protein VEK55_04025 [Xanthobacteraceae bacterium]|nr:hypothetical protein [Xanthobacteraceae bacterium]